MTILSRRNICISAAGVVSVIFTVMLWHYILLPWLAPFTPWLQPIVRASNIKVRNVIKITVPHRFYQKHWIDLTRYKIDDNPVLPRAEGVVDRGEFLLGSFALWLFVFENEYAAENYFQSGVVFLNEAAKHKRAYATLIDYKLYQELGLGDENLIYYNYNSRDMLHPNATRHMLFVKRCQTVTLFNIIDYDPSQAEGVVAIDIAKQLDRKIQEEFCPNN